MLFILIMHIYATGEKILITNSATGDRTRAPAWQAYTLPSRYKSRLVPQGSTSYIYHYYIFIPSILSFVQES